MAIRDAITMFTAAGLLTFLCGAAVALVNNTTLPPLACALGVALPVTVAAMIVMVCIVTRNDRKRYPAFLDYEEGKGREEDMDLPWWGMNL